MISVEGRGDGDCTACTDIPLPSVILVDVGERPKGFDEPKRAAHVSLCESCALKTWAALGAILCGRLGVTPQKLLKHPIG